MSKMFSGVAGLALACWLCYYVVTGSLFSFAWKAKSEADKCADMALKRIQMEGNVPRDFAAENALQ